MPFAIKKNPGTKTYRVVNTQTGRVHAFNATHAHAKAQLRLLESFRK